MTEFHGATAARRSKDMSYCENHHELKFSEVKSGESNSSQSEGLTGMTKKQVEKMIKIVHSSHKRGQTTWGQLAGNGPVGTDRNH